MPPAYDLSATLSDFPILLSDFWRMLSDTGTCDIVVDPVDDTDGYGTNIMGILNAYTRAGASITAWADQVGSITPGKWADFVILDGRVPVPLDASFRDLAVGSTWLAGRQVYAKPQ